MRNQFYLLEPCKAALSCEDKLLYSLVSLNEALFRPALCKAASASLYFSSAAYASTCRHVVCLCCPIPEYANAYSAQPYF